MKLIALFAVILAGCAGSASVKDPVKTKPIAGKLERVLIIPPTGALESAVASEGLQEAFNTQMTEGFKAKGVEAKAVTLNPNPKKTLFSLEDAWKVEKTAFKPRYAILLVPKKTSQLPGSYGREGTVLDYTYTLLVFDPAVLDTILKEKMKDDSKILEAATFYRAQIQHLLGSPVHGPSARVGSLTETILDTLAKDGLL